MNRKALALLFSSLLAVTAPNPTAIAQDDVSEAIDDGIEFLLKEIAKKQEGPLKEKQGQVALETYALAVAGVDVDHPLMKKNIDYLIKHVGSGKNNPHTYTFALIIFAIDAVISQMEADQYFISGRRPRKVPGATKLYSALQRATDALVKSRIKDKGMWDYHNPKPNNRYDNSNTQFAVLGLGAGVKRGAKVPITVWKAIADHFMGTQQKNGPEVKDRVELRPEAERGEEKHKFTVVEKERKGEKKGDDEKKGEPRKRRGRTVVVVEPAVPEIGEESIKVYARGWGYDGTKSPTWNMTNAGVSSLILAERNLRGTVEPSYQNKLNKSLRDGLGWLMKNWIAAGGSGDWKYYGIYSLEKVGDLGEIKKFGKNDWYKQISTHVVSEQNEDGSWIGGKEERYRVDTSLALLVLNRATTLLTQRAQKTVITGPGASKTDDDRDQWVFIQKLNREVHLPTLFRMLRFRPHPALATYVRLVTEDYPVDKIGNLIPGLTKAYQELTAPKFKKLMLDQLEAITGVVYENPNTYLVWYRRWKEVDDVGTKIQRDQAGWLTKVYRKTNKSLPLRRKIIWALARLQAKETIPEFIEDLNHEDEGVREAAYIALTTMPISTDPLPAFDSRAPSTTRQEQIDAITAWYKAAGK